jgi:ribonuclease D
VALTKRLPASADAIKPMKGLTEKTLERNRNKIWAAIERGVAGDLPDLPNGNHRGAAPDDGYEARVDLALAYIKGACLAAKVDPALIGNRSEITALVLEAADGKPEDHRMLRGWRAGFCGQRLLELLQGNGSVGIDPASKLPKRLD